MLPSTRNQFRVFLGKGQLSGALVVLLSRIPLYPISKLVLSLLALQGLYVSYRQGAADGTFEVYSCYLLLYSAAEFSDGSLMTRRLVPRPLHLALKGAAYSLLSAVYFAAAGIPLVHLGVYSVAFALLPAASFGMGLRPDKGQEGWLLFSSLLVLLAFSGTLQIAGTELALPTAIIVMFLISLRRGRSVRLSSDGALSASTYGKLTLTSFFVATPRYLDIVLLHIFAHAQSAVEIALHFRLANMAARFPMLLYSNYFPARVPSIEHILKSRYSIAAVVLAVLTPIFYIALCLMIGLWPLAGVAAFSLAVCLSAFLGEMLRYYGSANLLLLISAINPAIILTSAAAILSNDLLPFDMAVALSYSVSTLVLLTAGCCYETFARGRSRQ